MNETIKVVIVDDHTLFRDAVIEVLARDAQIKVIGQGGTAAEAVYLVERLRPDILLLDLAMPGGGMTSAWVLASTYPDTKIVALTSSEAEDDILGAARAGFCAYILKGVTGQALIEKIHKVYAGDCLDFPSLQKHARD